MGARRRTIATTAVIALVTALGAAACTSSPPGPQDAATALAAALESGDLDGVAFTPDVSADQAEKQRTDAYDAVVEALGEDALRVSLVSAETLEDDDALADAVLRFTWSTAGSAAADSERQWTYETTARLERDDEDVWRTHWASTILAPDLTVAEDLVVSRETPQRANVLGAGGEVLVEARDVFRVGIDKTFLPAAEAGAAARGLAAALEIDPDEYAKRVESAGDKAFVEAIVIRREDSYYDVPALRKLPGVNAIDDSLPLAPTRTFARPILGTVGTATAEIIEKSGGAIQAGDLTGLSGLQRQFDEQLRGRPGLRIDARGIEGSGSEGQARTLFTVPAVDGEPLQLTLDSLVQQSAENVLASVGPASAIVAIRPSTGEVLAAASGPGSQGLSTATLGQYAPGSTFKVVSALALLRAGLTPDSSVTCTDGITVDGRRFDNFPDYPAAALGDIPLRTAFANSCNTAFIGLRDETPQDAVVDAAGSLGLLPTQSLGFASFVGAVPSDSDGTDHAATMIGQGRVLASPLGMATVAASVAAGRTVTPHLVEPGSSSADDATDDSTSSAQASDDESDESSKDAETTDEPRPHVDLTSDEGAALRSLMRAVVTDGGAGFLRDLPGEVMAKTGTAQFGETDDLRNHVWMIAIQGDLAVAVFVDEGEYGSTTAGPLLTRFLESPVVAALTD
ncbi:cell division protein FtsI [Cellulomonas persica]|uniref:Beta-lactamase n=1 Tax=Cellulomonas persica TaxID=76861 RepID=A0A510UT19_9CELL|nr:cell division protein FtsI [Cellulomonas persica]